MLLRTRRGSPGRLPLRRSSWPSALVAFGAAPMRVSAQDEEVRVGDFVLLKSVDFLTDAVTHEWARSGDPRPTFGIGAVTRGDGLPGYNTLDLTCREGELLIRIYYEPRRSGRGVTTRRDRDSPPRRPVPVQMRFDSDQPGLDARCLRGAVPRCPKHS